MQTELALSREIKEQPEILNQRQSPVLTGQDGKSSFLRRFREVQGLREAVLVSAALCKEYLMK